MRLPIKFTKRASSPGFSFIEVLLVIMILVIIIAVLLTFINPAKRMAQARDAQRKSHIGQIASLLGVYYAQNKIYPSSYQELLNSGVMKGVLHDPVPGTRYQEVGTNDYYLVTGDPILGQDQSDVAVMAVLEAPDNANEKYWVFKSICGDADSYAKVPINTQAFAGRCDFYNVCKKENPCKVP